jgi:DNA primase
VSAVLGIGKSEALQRLNDGVTIEERAGGVLDEWKAHEQKNGEQQIVDRRWVVEPPGSYPSERSIFRNWLQCRDPLKQAYPISEAVRQKFQIEYCDGTIPRERRILQWQKAGLDGSKFTATVAYLGRAIIPIHDEEGCPIAFAARLVDVSCADMSNRKELYPPGFKAGEHLFNLHRVQERASILVVEGLMGVLALDVLGYSAVSVFGSELSAKQVRLLARTFQKVGVLFDGDDAGRIGARKAVRRLRRFPIDVVRFDLPNGLDPGNAQESQLLQALQHPH